MNEWVVEFNHISIDYEMKRMNLHAVTDVSLKLFRGKITALVGESGSGKTTLANALLDCISEPGRVVSGDVVVHSEKSKQSIFVTSLSPHELNHFRWDKVSMVFQG
ncbi:MAG: ATP-binding cassette domain-containing protein, partial [Erysipelotrichaceae bacterium]|nr:ATP-binding cassette domain-containing protein [Erysipelotrichaceae bacterium]